MPRAIALALVLLVALPPTAGTRTYRIMTEEQASALVRDYGAMVAAAVGVDARMTETRVARSACENRRGEFARDGRFYVQGNWQMPLPAAMHPATLAQLRDSWAAQGYKIKSFRMFSDIEGVVVAENPADEVEVAVTSTVPPTAVAVLVLSACYRPPAASPGSSPN